MIMSLPAAVFGINEERFNQNKREGHEAKRVYFRVNSSSSCCYCCCWFSVSASCFPLDIAIHAKSMYKNRNLHKGEYREIICALDEKKKTVDYAYFVVI